MTYKMLDLFSGLGGFSQCMKDDPKWKVVTVDIKEKFEPTICKDVLELSIDDLPDDFRIEKIDLTTAGTPCQTFSPGSYYNYWKKVDENPYHKHLPKEEKKERYDKAMKHFELARHTISLIRFLNPRYWFYKNPYAGKLNPLLKQHLGIEPEGYVTRCQYTDKKTRMQPRYLWGDHPEDFECRNCDYGDPCHISAGRGARKGAQAPGMTAEKRAEMPRGLSLQIKNAVEENIPAHRQSIYSYA